MAGNTRTTDRPPRPEDATSYAEFQEGMGREMAQDVRELTSSGLRLRRAGIFIALPLGYLFLIGAVAAGPAAPWWEWAAGLGLSALFVWLAAVEIRRGYRAHERRRQRARLTRDWRERVESGRAALSNAVDPEQRSVEENRIRAQLAFEHDLEEATRSLGPEPRVSSTALVRAWYAWLAGVLLLDFAVVAAAAFRAPLGVVWALVIAMPAYAMVGGVLGAVFWSRLRAERTRQTAALHQVTSRSAQAARLSAPKGIPLERAELIVDAVDAASRRRSTSG